ncbi:undecaprenyl-diphosphate phosphatase [Leadbettera azotonutricia]|uniref:Undecaprenyl-diphosphatase n=1 Tax=Leadbettera azotonutricia (strain ATCC BAA-888 / DSM 13862 / ZAS-9) TaxID=545695 RepID=F5Y8N8_LEAAZ|nr:undecaprenyl-diphosphate phosphatase [Leadbettera azotonutricia]AEF82310.1 undecaprenyl-diphosphatase [Leadbettera azotonutricia ZAS-9]
MTIFEALILGVVQGITEFLPVSSSGHLVLLQKIFGITESALLFDTMVHVGTLVAVFAVLWKDIWAILKRIFQPLTLYLIIATLPAVVFALLFKDKIEGAFASGGFLGFAFLATSILLVASELLFRRAGPNKAGEGGKPRTRESMTWLDALIIGLLQAVAIIPGVSRSGSTLSGALSRKLDRDFAARFSFLLSIPAILGALVLQVKDLAGGAPAGASADGGIGVGAIAAGTIAAAIVGFFSVRFMLKIVKERSLFGFAAYTAALGVLVLVDQFGTHLFF